MEELLDGLNKSGFAYSRDFVLKTCLTLLDKGARYEVQKFRQPEVRVEIESKWDAISEAIRDVADFVVSRTYVHSDKAMSSYIALIPLIYLRYHHYGVWKEAEDLQGYLLRTLLTGAFTDVPDQMIDEIVKYIRDERRFELRDVYEIIRGKGKSLAITEDRLWGVRYGDDAIHVLFNLMYRSFNYTPAYSGNLPEADHIFPRAALKKIKVINEDTGRKVMKFGRSEQDHFANCMLLTKGENGPGENGEKTPDVWLRDKSREYLEDARDSCGSRAVVHGQVRRLHRGEKGALEGALRRAHRCFHQRLTSCSRRLSFGARVSPPASEVPSALGALRIGAEGVDLPGDPRRILNGVVDRLVHRGSGEVQLVPSSQRVTDAFEGAKCVVVAARNEPFGLLVVDAEQVGDDSFRDLFLDRDLDDGDAFKIVPIPEGARREVNHQDGLAASFDERRDRGVALRGPSAADPSVHVLALPDLVLPVDDGQGRGRQERLDSAFARKRLNVEKL